MATISAAVCRKGSKSGGGGSASAHASTHMPGRPPTHRPHAAHLHIQSLAHQAGVKCTRHVAVQLACVQPLLQYGPAAPPCNLLLLCPFGHVVVLVVPVYAWTRAPQAHTRAHKMLPSARITFRACESSARGASPQPAALHTGGGELPTYAPCLHACHFARVPLPLAARRPVRGA